MCVSKRERERERESVIDANGMYKKGSEINWKLSGWAFSRGEFKKERFHSSKLNFAFRKKICF